MSRILKSTRLGAVLTAAALVITACGGGSESAEDSMDRNTAISAQSLQRLLPVGFSVAPGEKAAVVVGGTETEICVIDHLGSLWCWGRSRSGLVQNQAPGVSPAPVRIPMPNNQYVTAVASGNGDVMCAIAGGEVFCWGLNAARIVDAQWGGYIIVPTRIPNIGSPAVDIALGANVACAVVIDGSVRCWGDGRGGAMTAESFADASIRGPVTLPFVRNAVKITGGTNNFCVIDSSSLLACWGASPQGQLGLGAAGPTFAARYPLADQQVVDVAMSVSHTCAVLVTGVVKCFGDNSSNQLGVDNVLVPSSATPRTADGLRVRAVSVSVGAGQSCANDVEGQVWCWGQYPGTFGQWWGAQKVPGMTNVMALGSNRRSSPAVCAATWAGQLLCAGYDFDGSVGNGLPVNSHTGSAVTLAGFGVTLAQNVATTAPAMTTTTAGQVTVPTVSPTTTAAPASTVPATVTVPTVATTTPLSDAAQAQGSSSTTAASSDASSVPTATAAPQTTTASSPSDLSSVTVPPVSSPSTVRRVLSVKVGKKVDSKTMSVFAGISAPKSSKVKVVVSKAGSRFCKTSGTSVQGKKVGVCSVTIGVTPKGQKTRQRTIFVNVVA